MFKVGDKARVKYVRISINPEWVPGTVVTIISLNPGDQDTKHYHDCTVQLESGAQAYPIFSQLEPLVDNPSWESIQEITKGWNPTKEIAAFSCNKRVEKV